MKFNSSLLYIYRITPVKTSAISRPNYGEELSLSDNETAENKSTKSKRRAAVTSEVVVVETSGDDLNASGEVPTRSFTIESPVKVIRHSPSPSFSDSKEVKSKTSKSNTNHSFDETKQGVTGILAQWVLILSVLVSLPVSSIDLLNRIQPSGK